MSAELTRHEGQGYSLSVPSDWTDQTPQVQGVLFVAIEPGQDHPASVVVTAENPHGVTSFADWQEQAETGLEQQLSSYRLLDFRRTRFGAADGVVRTAAHTAGDTPITMQQYITAPGTTGWTVTVSAPDWRFPGLRPMLEQVGLSFRCEATA